MMSFITKLAGVDFQLVNDGPILISHEAEMMVIHLGFLEILDEFLVLEIVDD